MSKFQSVAIIDQVSLAQIKHVVVVADDTTFTVSGLGAAETISLQSLIEGNIRTITEAEALKDTDAAWINSQFNGAEVVLSATQNTFTVVGRGFYRLFTTAPLAANIKVIMYVSVG